LKRAIERATAAAAGAGRVDGRAARCREGWSRAVRIAARGELSGREVVRGVGGREVVTIKTHDGLGRASGTKKHGSCEERAGARFCSVADRMPAKGEW
jgi:hypothetical protein